MAIDTIHQPGKNYDSAASLQRLSWNAFAKISFRIFFIYFFIQVVPLDWKFYRDIFHINFASLQFADIFNIAHYSPWFFSGGQTYADWGIIFLLSITGAFIWTIAGNKKLKEYNLLYYWLRVLVRYRLAIAVIAYGFIKLFPIQAPYPSLSNLNTNYGDFTRWKLFSLSLGIVPGYETFLGAVEIATGLLLLYRKTASVGAFIVIIFTGNVFMSNLAYEGGEQVYSLYLITLALFVLTFDVQRLADLLVFQKPAAPVHFKPHYQTKARFYTKITLKTVFILFFVLLYGWQTGAAFYSGTGRFPQEPGLKGTTGIYNVAAFRINNDSIGYSATDPNRWQDVVFEKWNTISIRSNRPVVIDSNNVENFDDHSPGRAYELQGSAARHYYTYVVDTVTHTLLLKNKNRHYGEETLLLHYRKAGDSSIVLTGINERKDSIFVVLDKLNKKYLLEEVAQTGRQKPIKL